MSELVVELKQAHNKCEALKKRKTKSEEKLVAVSEELRISQASLEEMRKSGTNLICFLVTYHIYIFYKILLS